MYVPVHCLLFSHLLSWGLSVQPHTPSFLRSVPFCLLTRLSCVSVHISVSPPLPGRLHAAPHALSGGNLIWVCLVFPRIPFSRRLPFTPSTKINRDCPAKSSGLHWCWLYYLVITFQTTPAPSSIGLLLGGHSSGYDKPSCLIRKISVKKPFTHIFKCLHFQSIWQLTCFIKAHMEVGWFSVKTEQIGNIFSI